MPHHLWWILSLLVITVSPLWAGSVTLAWDASPVAQGYRIYWGHAPRTYHTVSDVGQVTTAEIAGLTDGQRYYFTTTAYQGTEESAQSNEVQTVVGSLVPSDTTPPTVAITSPTKGSTVRRNSSVTITADARDERRVQSLEYRVDGQAICAGVTPPNACAWKVPGAKQKAYSLEVWATDEAGNVGVSPPIPVRSSR